MRRSPANTDVPAAGTRRSSTPSPLLIDLYELTMARSYIEERMEGLATFSLFARQLPPDRGYLVAAGLSDALAYLESFAFGAEDLAYLESTGLFSPQTLDCFSRVRFTGSVQAMPEGTICFADEPMLEVTAPIVEAQLVETILINEIQLQTMVATKAARCATAAQGRRLVDFSLRRTQGPETGLKVARASYIGGFDATSNVLAGQRHGIPISGTMAHSYVEAFPTELEAFRAYARAYPDTAVLVIDTYDTIAGARQAAMVGHELAARGRQLRGVRIDSGDLNAASRSVRRILDEAGLPQAIIFVSGGLDEHAIEEALGAGAPIDGFGVGTRLGVSADAPHIDLVYKLVEYEGRPVFKLSEGKATWPGRKQAWRSHPPLPLGEGRGEGASHDRLGLAHEVGPADAEPLLVEVMADGQRLAPDEPLEIIRERVGQGLAELSPEALRLRRPTPCTVRPTKALLELQRELAARVRSGSRMEHKLTQ